MNFLDKIALNRLIKIITSFILGLIKIFKPTEDTIIPPLKRQRPLIDKLKKWIQ